MRQIVALVADIADDACVHGHDVAKHTDLINKLPKKMRHAVTDRVGHLADKEQQNRMAMMRARLTPSRFRVHGIAVDRLLRYWARSKVRLPLVRAALEIAKVGEQDETLAYWWRQGKQKVGMVAKPTERQIQELEDLLEDASVLVKNRSK